MRLRKGGKKINDDILIKKILEGNSHAFSLLVNKYRQDIFKVVYGMVKNPKDAEDVTQEIFIKIYTSLASYQNQGFKTWISRIAVHHTIDWLRKQREWHLLEEEEQEKLASSTYLEKDLLQKELKELVHTKLQELPPNYLDVVQLFYLEEKSYEEIAAIKQVEKKTVETQLYRARLWMKKHWEEEEFV